VVRVLNNANGVMFVNDCLQLPVKIAKTIFILYY
jgi:hypothetical protein